MANAAYIEFYDDQGAKIDGGVKISGREGTVEALSFNHEIRIPTDAQSGALTGTRKHEPLTFTKKFDKSSPYMYKAVCKGQTFKKVVIHWFEINDKGAETEYFQHELNDVKITSVKPIMFNVKDMEYERYPHLEEVSLRYAKIKWLYNDGGLEYTDSWTGDKAA
jgi:type VI secretion system secreted protein Hcp